jgi:hypothetical protein
LTAAEYRKRAVLLLRSRHPDDLPDETVRQADVWARLAVSASISETTTQTDAEVD